MTSFLQFYILSCWSCQPFSFSFDHFVVDLLNQIAKVFHVHNCISFLLWAKTAGGVHTRRAKVKYVVSVTNKQADQPTAREDFRESFLFRNLVRAVEVVWIYRTKPFCLFQASQAWFNLLPYSSNLFCWTRELKSARFIPASAWWDHVEYQRNVRWICAGMDSEITARIRTRCQECYLSFNLKTPSSRVQLFFR